MSFKKSLAGALIVSGLALSSFASLAQAATQQVNVAMDSNNYPFSYVDENGAISGYDGDLLKIIQKKLPEYKFTYSTVSQDAILTGLKTGAYDLSSNHFYLNKDRAKSFDYSHEPTGISDLRLIVRKDDNSINSLDDIATKHKKLNPINVNDARYTVIEQYNQTHPKTPITLTPSGEESALDMFRSVDSGEYDAAIYPIGGYLSLIKKVPLNIKASASVGLFPTIVLYKKGEDPVLISKIDNILKTLKQDGTLAKLSEKWYQENVYTLPGADKVVVKNDL
ncbi:transporter substrate-binding domain-containing protein [Tatumella citrea]|uniref:Amino acid ABC transporter substrate-binding protein n=1 Tax=Tatumella citrea TaxID=53336 RepID=A0A1Y0LN21_TATCI|nr:transporter substrate-binding domain-containing protein [Tatumella citrea]ARU95383.1 amino acid ABC transporter substrate-binding protein [Tatumella citrea]ARU99424.1 amino acid ABC transporter substrate-binding protein [Tatumella citrea]